MDIRSSSNATRQRPGPSYRASRIWAGANDLFDGQTNPLIPADNLKADIQTLISKGAKNFLVANLPSLDQTPLGQSEGLTAQAGLKLLTAGFNLELAADLGQIQAANPDVQLHRLDAFGLFQSVIGNPTSYGLTNVTAPAILFAPGGPDSAFADGFLFFDAVHPTQAAGKLIGASASAAVAPEPSSAALLLIGGAGILGCGRMLRRKA
ncbi:MAG TPA: hypothetical protein DDY78_27950 [Planctomycetales bacterium]|jgi:phospholipase/lecithinase/hemolysin|nr:hypothetical protein [Planctomycetales bacterium]